MRRVALIGLLVLSAASAGHAMWYGENVGGECDIIMMDMRWPYWTESTYYAYWNSSVGGGQDSFSFYGGHLSNIPPVGPNFRPDLDPEKQDKHTLGSNWAFWGTNKKTGEPPRVVATSRFNYPHQYIGEGGSGALYGDGWRIRRNKWYTMLLRLWSPIAGQEPGCCYIGRWVKDVEADYWYLYGIIKLPTEGKFLRHNAGFMEDFGAGARSVRSIHRRLGYYREKGEWKKSDVVSLNLQHGTKEFGHNCVATTLEDGKVFAIEYSCNQTRIPVLLKGLKPRELGKTHKVTLKQPDLPTLDKVIVKDVKARSTGRQIIVSWKIPPSSAPQLAYKVEVFDNRECEGEPVAMREERMPIVRKVLLPAGTRTATVRLSVTDIFDQAAEPVVVRAVAAAPAAPAARAATRIPGLKYRMYIENTARHINIKTPASKTAPQSLGERHFLVSVDELTDARLKQQGVCSGIDTGLHDNRSHGYGFKFDGFLRVPRTGIYLFSVQGCDGYRIVIDGKTALEYDGIHGPEDRDFALNLARGDHPIAIAYYFDKGKPFFRVRWEGPGFERQDIPESALRYERAADLPELAMTLLNAHKDGKAIVMKDGVVTTEPVGSSRRGTPGMVALTLDVKGKGRAIEKLHLYHDDMMFASIPGRDLQKPYTCERLLPAGDAVVWARLYYDTNKTIDTKRMPVTVGLSPVEGWKVGNAGEAKAKYNLVQTAKDAFTFLGEGEFAVYQKVNGDFTLTCKIDSYTGQNREPVNPAAFLGLSVRTDGGAHWQRSGPYFAFRRHLHSTRMSPNFGDPGGTRSSWEAYPSDMPWLRIVRKGKANWSAWQSRDGREWVYASTYFLPLLNDEMDAGLVFSALPQDSQMYFRANMSHVTLEPGTPDHFELQIPPARGTAEVTMTGVAVSLSNCDVVVVRTTDRGLLRTTDRGKTWRSANGKLTGAANAVRSVAIHPADPEIMIRAAGITDKEGRFEGGLYKTTDGGKSWKRLGLDADFDGSGPSALCGEVVTFVQNQPDNVVVGAETKGLFLSKDGGVTWKCLLPGGERFTAVKVNRFGVKTGKEAMQVYALTCPDKFLPVLGRGESRFVTKETVSRIYRSINSGDAFLLSRTYDTLGNYNVSFNNYNLGECNVATSHGILFSMNKFGNYLMTHNPNLDGIRPFTALGTSRVKGAHANFSCTVTQAINPKNPRHFSFCGASGHIFGAIKAGKRQLKGALKIEPGDLRLTASGDEWWLLGPDGLYYSSDRCKSFTRMEQ